MPVTKMHPACTIHEDGVWLPLWLDFKKKVTDAKISPKMVNPRNIAGNAEEELVHSQTQRLQWLFLIVCSGHDSVRGNPVEKRCGHHNWPTAWQGRGAPKLEKLLSEDRPVHHVAYGLKESQEQTETAGSTSSSAIDCRAGQVFSPLDATNPAVRYRSSSSAIDSHAGQIFSPVDATNPAVRYRSSSSAIDSHAGQLFSPVGATEPAVRWRSSAGSHSLVARSAPCGHVSWRLSAYFGQNWRTWSGVWSACQHSHREVSETPILFRWALRPQCPVRRRKMVVCWARCSLQIGSRCAWYAPFSFLQSPLYREWRSVLASL